MLKFIIKDNTMIIMKVSFIVREITRHSKTNRVGITVKENDAGTIAFQN
jgi:hypothetical protein